MGRGRTMCKDIQDLSRGTKIKVEVKKGRPVGDSAKKLSTWCGYLARDGRLLPIDRSNWKKVDKVDKNRVWKMVLENFDIDDAIQGYIMKSLGKKWRDHKCELKAKYYNNCAAIEDLYARGPENVVPKQWQTLMNFWGSVEGKKRSERNKQNRSHQTLPHTSGTKSFARVFHEEENKSNRHASPTRAEVFIITHAHINGLPVNNVAADMIRQMKHLLENEGTQDSNSPNDVYSQVMGRNEKPGRVRGFGLGPTTSLWGSSSYHGRPSTSDFNAMQNKVQQMEEEMKSTKQELKEQVNSTKQQLVELMMKKDIEISELRSMIHGLFSR